MDAGSCRQLLKTVFLLLLFLLLSKLRTPQLLM